MSSPVISQEPEPASPRRGWVGRLFRWLGMLLLMAAVGTGAALLTFEFRMQAVQTSATADLNALRQDTMEQVAELRSELRSKTTALEEEIQAKQASLEADLKRVEEAAQSAGLLMEQNGELTTLQSRLAEIDALRQELRTAQEQMEQKMKALEDSVKEQLAASEQETAAALSVEMTVKGLLVKAQGEVLLAQVYWAEGNRGLARDELAIAQQSLMDALEAAPAQAKADLQKVVDLAESTRAALILESNSARDQLNLLWHEVSARLSKDW
ncbi:MAG: hypothetical protein AB2385_03275 [Symbiobacterium sp.]|uniref:hypothetical protein n=1 Tax=Symbiobacterium sp. TaxID=1971213 RepID=UPI003464C7AE